MELTGAGKIYDPKQKYLMEQVFLSTISSNKVDNFLKKIGALTFHPSISITQTFVSSGHLKKDIYHLTTMNFLYHCLKNILVTLNLLGYFRLVVKI